MTNVNKNMILLLAVIAAVFMLGGFKLPGAFVGGSPVSISSVQITNDPTIPFSQEYLAQIALDGGATYLQGQTSAPVQAPGAASTFTVKYQLNSFMCVYSLTQDSNTLSGLAVNSYLPPNSNNLFGGNPWSYACRVNAGAMTLLSNSIYKSYSIQSDSYGNPIYCNAFPTGIISPNACQADYISLCNNQAGYHAISCTIPNSQSDAFIALLVGAGNPYNGYACVNVSAHNRATADYTFSDAVGQTRQFSSTITVQKTGASPESFDLNSANNYQNHASDVYAKSTFTANSLNLACDPYSNLMTETVTQSGSSLPVLASAFTSAKAAFTTAMQSPLNANNLNGVLSQVGIANAQMSSLSSSWTASSPGGFPQLTISGNQLSIDRSISPPEVPIIQMWINAAWLGVVSPVAVPSLGAVSPNPISMTSGVPVVATFPVSTPNAGSISVALPTCVPAVAPGTFNWVNNPNKGYNAGDTYTASFQTTGATQGAYACTINAQSGGNVINGNYNPTSTKFALNVAGVCTNPANPPFYRNPQPNDPCHVSCPLDPSIAGRDICAQQGQIYNAGTCSCTNTPGCQVTNTCPPSTACSDGTNIGICSTGTAGSRCLLNTANVPTLTADPTCNSNCNVTGTCPPPPPQCLPIVQYPTTATPITIFGFQFGSVGTTGCNTDYLGIALLIVGAAVLLKYGIGKRR